jgi:hypothetical protein
MRVGNIKQFMFIFRYIDIFSSPMAFCLETAEIETNLKSQSTPNNLQQHQHLNM